MDEPAKHVAPTHREPWRLVWGGPTGRHVEAEAAMRALLVVVAEVLAEDRFKLAPPEHQGPVEALRAYGPHETFSVGVRSRRPHGGLDHLYGFRSEDVVEAGGELCIAVPGRYLTRLRSWRSRTRTWWRRTTSSTSLSTSWRQHETTSARTRHSAR